MMGNPERYRQEAARLREEAMRARSDAIRSRLLLVAQGYDDLVMTADILSRWERQPAATH